MNLRRVLERSVVVAAAALACSGCGDTGAASPSVPPLPPTEPTHAFPTDPDVALVRVGDAQSFPSVVIGGDGWVYTAADAVESFGVRRGRIVAPASLPAPPQATPMVRRRLTRHGLQTVLDLGVRLGLFGPPPEYEQSSVTDVSTTTVTLVDDEGTYLHDVYGLGYGHETGDRAALAEFVDAVEDVASLVGPGELSRPEPYVPPIFHVAIVGRNYTEISEPAWPSGVPVVEGCQALAPEEFAVGVAGSYATSIDGNDVQISVVPDLPGDECG